MMVKCEMFLKSNGQKNVGIFVFGCHTSLKNQKLFTFHFMTYTEIKVKGKEKSTLQHFKTFTNSQ